MAFFEEPQGPRRGRDGARGIALMVLACVLAIAGVLAMSGVFGSGLC
jgi:hypothetical protein